MTTDRLVSPRPRGGGLSIGADLPDARPRAPVDRGVATRPVEGFAVGPSMFDRGVADGGSRSSWDELPSLELACAEHTAVIEAELRDDSVALVTNARMMPDGSLRVVHVDDPVHAPANRYVIAEDAFAAFVARVNIPGAGRYLRTCWPELRSVNVNAWIGRLLDNERKAESAAAEDRRLPEYTPLDMRLRHRVSRDDDSTREVFAVVGPAYADLDSDKIDSVIARSVDPSARARVSYDGRRTRWEILLHGGTVAFGWRPGVVLTTDDTGGGAVNGTAIVRNDETRDIIAIRTTTTATFSVRHVGEIGVLAQRVSAGIARAIGSIDTFTSAWEFAGAVASARLPHGIAGVFRDLIHREIIPMRGNREGAILELSEEWARNHSPVMMSRAGVVRTIVHWAHTIAKLDPWTEDEIQAGAGALLRRTKKGDGWAIALGSLAPEDA